MIKIHIGQPIIKGCFSWHAKNKELSTLLTKRQELYAAWKEGYRKAIPFVSTESLAKTMQTTISNRKNIEIIMEELRTQKNMLHNLYFRVAQTPILQEAQDLAKKAVKPSCIQSGVKFLLLYYQKKKKGIQSGSHNIYKIKTKNT